jgi:hypothetical protein
VDQIGSRLAKSDPAFLGIPLDFIERVILDVNGRAHLMSL